MERLKPLDQILLPDSLSASYIKVNRETMESRPVVIKDHHDRLSAICLDDAVPNQVKSYFETVKNICLYGWFVDAFYTVALFLSLAAIEMALRIKFQQEDPERRWKFPQLISEARKRGLITDDGFPSAKARYEYMKEIDPSIGPPVADYCLFLEKELPKLRNLFAHPEIDNNVGPAYAYPLLITSMEFINQLFKHEQT